MDAGAVRLGRDISTGALDRLLRDICRGAAIEIVVATQRRRREGVEPGVKRSETPGTTTSKQSNPCQGVAESPHRDVPVAPRQGLFCSVTRPGIPLRSIPGFNSGAPSGCLQSAVKIL
jgi:hypothetical protein